MGKFLSRKKHLVSPVWPVGSQFKYHNGSVDNHSHDFIELVIVLGGTGLHRIAQGEQVVEQGDVFVIRPGAVHSYWECRNLFIFNCFLGADFFEKELAFAVQNPLLNYLLWAGPLHKKRRGILTLKLAPEKLKACRPHIDACWALSNTSNPSQQIRFVAHVLMILDYVAVALRNATQLQGVPDHQIHPAVRDGIGLLENQLSHPWTLQELAHQLHFTPSYLARIFKREVGLAPMQYLARIRAEVAAHLLLTSSQNIAEVGAQVGWSDPSYFAERFKVHYGLTAKEYRQKHSGVRT
jgi:AraC family L-rhamnose operon transcriptional activator RhaR